MKNIRIFYLKICQFLVVKFSIYLNIRVFVMENLSCVFNNSFGAKFQTTFIFTNYLLERRLYVKLKD